MTLPPEPSLADVFKALWLARRYVILGAIFGLAGAALFLLLSVPHYRITMLVAPAERAAQTDVKALLPDNPSFALQYLVNTMGSQDSSDFMRFENTLRGPSVAALLLKDPKAAEGLGHSQKFRVSPSVSIDTPEKLSAVLEKKIAIMPVGNTPLRRIVIDHPSAEFGAALLRRLYSETDRLIRNEVAENARKRSLYLKDMLDKVNHPDHRRALTSLLMEQEHILMILAMDEPFVAIIAEPPSASVKPWWPRKNLILAGFAFVGMVLGFAVWGAKQRG
ncbi:MAG: Wzz/FepE/Etk N-terminal domain-containing protein [Micavibrio sp.]